MVPCLLYILCRCCYAPYQRGKIRDTYNIEGSFIGDCCTHICCAGCAILQESFEVNERGTVTASGAPQGQTVA